MMGRHKITVLRNVWGSACCFQNVHFSEAESTVKHGNFGNNAKFCKKHAFLKSEFLV